MFRIFALLLSIVCSFLAPDVYGQRSNSEPLTEPWRISGFQSLSDESVIAFTQKTIFRTDDSGKTWNEISPGIASDNNIASVRFLNFERGFALTTNSTFSDLFFSTTKNGGLTWTHDQIPLRFHDLNEASFANSRLEILPETLFRISVPLPSSSNFIRATTYESRDGGATWYFARGSFEANDDKSEAPLQEKPAGLANDETILKSDGEWILTARGDCVFTKQNCFQETRIYRRVGASFRDLTPAKLVAIKNHARLEALSALSPGGSTRISLARGFDKCTAAPASQMQTWWNNSPFYDVNIYIGGNSRGCSQPQLTATWVTQVSQQGWGLIPTWVGPQAPCTTCTSCVNRVNADPAIAETEGRTQSDLAIAAANNLGLTQGTIIYYDMERYADTGCGAAVNAFLKGWTDRLKQLGYKSGTYGSPFNANIDWVNIAPASKMDAVWLARWNNVMSVWGVAPLPDSFWSNHQRIHQWLGERSETWGGITFNIDNNISDAPLVGAAIPRNKIADFDGDGKTDVSVWRPETGVWYVLYSSNSTFASVPFGIASDVITPGDYDGDGKTDFCVWRAGNGVWHTYTKAFNYRAYQFGVSTDIPVPADYDGDGRTDVAVFRPSTGVWYIANSFDSRGTSFRIEQFGLAGDKPVPGDYDGDGKSDLAVFRPSDGFWYVLGSANGYFGVNFGLGTDTPVQADYDGDGKTDFAVYRDGIWYLLQSQQGFSAFQFGIATDIPMSGDYDGDGKADAAVYRDGIWYLLQSQSGVFVTQFGLAGDKPIPRSYHPLN